MLYLQIISVLSDCLYYCLIVYIFLSDILYTFVRLSIYLWLIIVYKILSDGQYTFV